MKAERPAIERPLVAVPLVFLLAVLPSLSSRAGQAASGAPATRTVGLDLEGMDTSVAPGDDFFEYANGTWLKETPIPPQFAAYGAAYIVYERTEEQVAALIEGLGKAGLDGDARKIADFYASYRDEAAIEARGLEPLQPRLAAIAGIADRRALATYLGGTLRADVDAFNYTDTYTDNLLGLWVAADLDEPARYSPFLLQGGLDMPERAYYLDDSEGMEGVREAFRTHVANVLGLAGVRDPEARVGRVFDLEHRMAEVHWDPADTDDMTRGNNHWARPDFARLAPGLDWDAYFAAAGLADQPSFVVWQPSAVTGLAELVGEESLDVWKDYLTFHAVEHFAAVLPRAIVEERFAFHGRELLGVERLRDRKKRAVDATSDALGEALGRLYVQRHFPPGSKARIEAMVENIINAFGRRIDALDWMSSGTKAAAREKLAVLEVGVGYPDVWRDYSGLRVVRGDAFGNADRSERFEYRTALARLGQPVDRREWVMTPQTVNAVNLPVLNALNFPAAILQPPYFDPGRPEAMDYGAIGATIGHEISHSFDDQGAKFDAEGRMHDWWTDEDRAHFAEAGAALVRQYNAYRPFPDLPVNGRLTLGENIADVAGLASAYDAYRISLGGQPAPVVDGLTGDQQFLLSYAQSWRGKTREPALRQQLLGDGHSPDRYRAYAVRNLDAWYDAFDVKPRQTLFLAPAERVEVW
jgi:predicted metalloendopeptidase